MKLVIIFGPPASGKLTIGKLLSKNTSFPLLHNHLTNDLLDQFFLFQSKPFNKLNQRIRIDIIQTAFQEKLPGLILTYVWAFNYSSDKSFIDKLIKLSKQYKARTYFVELKCQDITLFNRILNPNRRQFNKISTKKTLTNVLEQYQMNSPSDYKFSAPYLAINTDVTKPKKAVDKITRFLRK
ncbi:MAG: AAA family ATPase [Patescibacteria group bacterium]